MQYKLLALLSLVIIADLIQTGATELSALDSIFLPPELDPFRDEYLETITRMSMHDLKELPQLSDTQFLDQMVKGVYSIPHDLMASTKLKNLYDPTRDEELEYFSKRESEWAEMMVGGPLSINYMSSVMTIASKKDFPFKPDFNFTLIKYPNSFRTTLVQVTNNMYNALYGAHTGMDRIQLNMRQIPNLLKTALKLITQATPKMISAMLPRTLSNIEQYALNSAETANATLIRFTNLQDLLQEIALATTDTNSENEAILDKLQFESAAMQQSQKEMEAMLADLKARQNIAREELEQARQKYHQAMLNVPGGEWNAHAWQVYTANRPAYRCGGRWFWRRCTDLRPNQFQEYTEEAKKKAAEALELLKKAEENSNKLFNEQMNKQNEMIQAITVLSNINFNSTSLNVTIKILLDAAGQIAKVQAQWSGLTRFFSSVANAVSDTQKIIMENFLGVISDAQALGFDIDPISKELYTTMLVENAKQIDGDAHQLFLLASTYLEVSNKYMVSQVAGLNGYLALQTDSERNSHVRSMANDAQTTSNRIKALLTQRQTEYQLATLSRQEEYQQFIDANIDDMPTGSAFSNVLKAKEDLQKSPEQLEQEKRSVIAQRVPALQIDGQSKDQLVEKAKQLHGLLHQLHGAIYELSERFERQKYDMVELTERARQIEKGKAKTRKSNIVHTGLGGGLFSGVNDVTATAPQKVSLFSRYERVTDRRTYKDRRDVWAIEKKKSEFVAERPKAKIRHNTPPPEENPLRKNKAAPAAAAAPAEHHEEEHEELPPPPPAAEEEEAPAAEEEPAAAEEEEEEEEEEE